MKLVDAYNRIRGSLQGQVQGTCGIYSFYNAVRILREIDGTRPSVPAPKKSEAASSATTSLREYAKRELKSGQGEILTEAEMTRFVSAWGYKPEAYAASTHSSRSDFIKLQVLAGHPVLVPYLAGDDSSGVVPITTPGPDDGAHWSLILDAAGTRVQVVEPNAPQALKDWELKDLLLSNESSDKVMFARYWAKTVSDEIEYKRQVSPTRSKLPKFDGERGITPITDPTNWKRGYDHAEDSGQVKLYDLGGRTGTRQDRMKLSNVLIAVAPPG